MAHRVMRGQKRRKALRWAEMALLVCALICIGMLVRRVGIDANRLMDERTVRDEIQKAGGLHGTLTSVGYAESQPTVEDQALDARMQAALSAGPDVVGVLEAGANIALYVPQGEDNSYYLTHDISGNSDSSGAAFLDARCSLSPRDTHLMIHGHNMRSGAVFGTLNNYRKESFVRNNPLFCWTTYEDSELYVLYAIADISVEKGDAHYYRMPQWNFSSDEEFMQFVNGLRERSVMQLPVDVQPGDELLSLVTCSYSYENGRLILALRKLREDEDPDAIALLFQEKLS